MKESQRFRDRISTLQSELEQNHYPEGQLVCCNSKNHASWYRSCGHTKTYIPKKDRRLAEQLAEKKYLSLTLAELTREKKALDSYLQHCSPTSEKSSVLLTQDSAYQELLTPYFRSSSSDLSAWANRTYEKNPHHPEHLIHKASSGHLVRSKSEALIDLLLYQHHIPFRYECALQLGSTTLFPDFTIRHPRTGSFYYWEHFGMMDNPTYSKNVGSKIHLYSSHGIIPSINLITTYETQQNPLNAEMVEHILEYYFL